ncbi:MAG: hypothetical protein NZM42_14340 [Gemmatales bacterium]|nr:hypothetical protein [Gemmatales bacterium]MDW8224169.1 hypothetical protein [Gemmatales bacterium]
MSISDELRQALLQEIRAYAQHISDEQARAICQQLEQALANGELDDHRLEHLGHVLTVSLESGRMRRLYGPHLEMQAERLFALTPQGLQIRARLEEANRAFEALAGQTLQEIAVALKGPGSFYLHLRTDRCRVRFLMNRTGLYPLDLET